MVDTSGVDQVWMLQHISHAIYRDGTKNPHVDVHGDLTWDEGEDDIKLIGVYRTQERAEQAMRQARTLPGFREEPDCFLLLPVDLDVTSWTEGFFSYFPGDTEASAP